MSKKVIVIGGGPAGYPAALKLKELGAEPVIVESWDLGGTCLNRGCIPSKSLLDVGDRIHAAETLKNLAAEGQTPVFSPGMLSWDKIKARRAAAVTKLRTSLEKLLQSKKIEVVRGRAAFTGMNEVTVTAPGGPKVMPFDFAVIAAGTAPGFPPPFNSFRPHLTDSNRVFDLPKLPKSVTIVGGGVIGLEFACFFNAMGSAVSVVELMPDILGGEDAAVTRAIRTPFEKRGIKFHLGRRTETIKIEPGAKTLVLDDGTAVTSEEILVGTGRVAHLSNLGLDKVGLSWDRKGIKTDVHMRTSTPHIYAVGDVNGICTLAHAASRQGELAAENIMGADMDFDEGIVPKCVYTWPEAATVGLNKAQAEARGHAVKTARAFFAGIGKAVTHEETDGFVQLVYDAASDKVLGAQIVGDTATEIIHVLAAAMTFGIGRKELRKMIFAHPTMAEAIYEVLSK